MDKSKQFKENEKKNLVNFLKFTIIMKTFEIIWITRIIFHVIIWKAKVILSSQQFSANCAKVKFIFFRDGLVVSRVGSLLLIDRSFYVNVDAEQNENFLPRNNKRRWGNNNYNDKNNFLIIYGFNCTIVRYLSVSFEKYIIRVYIPEK